MRWVFGFGVLVCVSGCGGDDSSDGAAGSTSTGGGGSTSTGGGGSGGSAGSTSGGGSAGTSSGGGSGGSTTSCSGSGSLTPGTSTVKVQHDGGEREYVLHVPPSYDGKTPMPLVLNFHGLGSNMTQQQLFSMMDGKSDSAGFIVAYPNGLKNGGNGQQSWNAGLCCAFGDTNRDDVGFTEVVLDDIFSKGCVDQKRVYSTGMSNGGYMSHYLGCKLADRIAAIAPVAGVLGISESECTPSRPMPIVHFHGTGDDIASYSGAPVSFQAWANINGCTGTPKETYKNGNAHCDTYDTCKDGVEVTLCTLDGEGHCWPGQTFCPFGLSTTDIVANDRMWELFQKFSL